MTVCRCGEEIFPVEDLWVDRVFNWQGIKVSPSAAAMCEDGGYHRPDGEDDEVQQDTGK